MQGMHRLGITSDLVLTIIHLPVFLSASPSRTETVACEKKIYIYITILGNWEFGRSPIFSVSVS